MTQGSSDQASKIVRPLGRGLQRSPVRPPAYRVSGDEPDAPRLARLDFPARLHEPVTDEIGLRRHTTPPCREDSGHVVLAKDPDQELAAEKRRIADHDIGLRPDGLASVRREDRVTAFNGGDGPPAEVHPPPSPRKFWTRKGVAHWLVERLAEDTPTLVGIDHGFSFPLRYFEVHGLEPDWPSFLDDFLHHWPTDEDHTYVDFVREGSAGNGAARTGNARWRRLTEERAGGAKSVFHFDVPGQVAKSTHAGIPWLRFIRQELGARVHFWPFDGWGHSGRAVRHCRGLSGPLVARLCSRGPHGRSARRLFYRSLAVAS